MWRVLPIAALAAILAACAAPTPRREDIPTRASDFRPSQIRQPVVFARLQLDGQYSDEERKTMPQELEGVLLDELNAHAVLAKQVRVSVGDATRDPGPAIAREPDGPVLAGQGDVAVGLSDVPVGLPAADRRDVSALGVLDLELLGEPGADQLLHERFSLGADRGKLVGLPAHDEVPTAHVGQARLGALELLKRALECRARGRLKRRARPPRRPPARGDAVGGPGKR